MAEKITHPILVGLLHPEGGKQWQELSELHTLLLPSLTRHLCSGTWVAVLISLTPYRSQAQLHEAERPFTCTALRTVYRKHQNNNSFCKDIMKLYEKLEFRVHKDSLAFSYWRRCSFHCRFLLNFGGVSTSGSERQMERTSVRTGGNSNIVPSRAVNYSVHFSDIKGC